MPLTEDRKQFTLIEDKDILDIVDRIAELAGCSRADIYKFATRQFLSRVDEVGTAEHELLAPLREFAKRAHLRRRSSGTIS